MQRAIQSAVPQAEEIAAREASARLNAKDFARGVAEVRKALGSVDLGSVSVPFSGSVKVHRADRVCSVSLPCRALSVNLFWGWVDVWGQDTKHPVARIFGDLLSDFSQRNALELYDVLPTLATAMDERLSEYLAKLPDPAQKRRPGSLRDAPCLARAAHGEAVLVRERG